MDNGAIGVASFMATIHGFLECANVIDELQFYFFYNNQTAL
jgi:hypothetical protein